MKIILYKDVPNLGEEGDVKTVADGYARNFLIPRKFAVKYTKATETELAQKQKAIVRRKEDKAKAAAGIRQQIEDLEMAVSVAAGDSGRLFGSVTPAAVADFLHSHGIEAERKRIELPDGGIKTVGSHLARVKLYGGDDAVLKVSVSPSGKTAPDGEAPAEPAIEPPESRNDELDDAEQMNQIAAEDLAANPAPGEQETLETDDDG